MPLTAASSGNARSFHVLYPTAAPREPPQPRRANEPLVGIRAQAYACFCSSRGLGSGRPLAPQLGRLIAPGGGRTLALSERAYGDFTTPVRFDEDDVVVEVRGELDVATAPLLQDLLDQLV